VTIAPITAGTPIQIPDSRPGWTVEPFTIPHDTADPVAYTVCIGDIRIGVITDLGRSTRLIERQLSSLDVAVLEFNHDVEMLLSGEYPWRLKQRVRGAHGHLSNDQAAALVADTASTKLKHLVLAHLSQDNNRPELAMEAAQSALSTAGATHVTVQVATQREALDPVALQAPLAASTRGPRTPRSRKSVDTSDDTTRQVTLF